VLGEVNEAVVKDGYANNADDTHENHRKGIRSEIYQLGNIAMGILIYSKYNLQYAKYPGQYYI
jgi:hypothetical protein